MQEPLYSIGEIITLEDIDRIHLPIKITENDYEKYKSLVGKPCSIFQIGYYFDTHYYRTKELPTIWIKEEYIIKNEAENISEDEFISILEA